MTYHICIWIAVCITLGTQKAKSQVYEYPRCNKQIEGNLQILRVVRGENSTEIDFQYTRSQQSGIYIFLNRPNTSGAYYIQVEGKKYKLLSSRGIANDDRVTMAFPKKPINFTATFEAIPKTVNQFDLVEGTTGTWHFYGIQLPSGGFYALPASINASNSSKTNISNECDNIISVNASPKPDFNTFLAGVKHAIILEKPEIRGHLPAFNGLIELLRAMEFESIKYFEDYIPSENPCEEVYISLGFDYNLHYYYNVKWIFLSPCLNYRWDFTSTQSAAAGIYDDGKANFYRLLRNMYQYKKPAFDARWTLNRPSQKTCWSENAIKEYIKSKGGDKLEGIYEKSTSTNGARYKIAVRKINGTYYFIYLAGATANGNNWKEGDIKAVLESTATPMFFKAKWFMSDKSVNEEFYVSFEQGALTLLSSNANKEIYIKLFPAISDGNYFPGMASSGSGFAISSNGYIATNCHVVKGAKRVKVRGVGGDFSTAYNAKIVSEDNNNDLAIIKIDDASFTTLGTIPYTILGQGADVGTSIFVLGYPLRATMGDEVKLTDGIISSRSGFQGDITTYQVTAAVQPGNSGGPMFDRKGNLIGVVNAKHKGAENASYAIKSAYLLNLIDLLPGQRMVQSSNLLNGKSLAEQVKIAKRFTYIIEAE